MTITRNFNLHLNAGASIPLLINANQYDSGEEWVFTLYSDRGVKYTPASGAIIGLKSDGHAIANNATVNGSGQIVVTETEQMTASVGKNIYELSIDSGTHGTANFIVLVEPQPYDESKASDSDISLFNQAINAAGEIEEIMGGETITEVISPVISDWLEDNMTNPSNPAIDTSLTVSGAAADAKVTGDAITDLNEAISTVSGVPTSVRYAIYEILNGIGYLEGDYSDELATIQSWAQTVTALTVSPSTLSLSGNTPQTLTATTTPAGETVSWESSNPAIATVNNGVVTGVRNGSCTITARCGDLTATCAVTVSGITVLYQIENAVFTGNSSEVINTFVTPLSVDSDFTIAIDLTRGGTFTADSYVFRCLDSSTQWGAELRLPTATYWANLLGEDYKLTNYSASYQGPLKFVIRHTANATSCEVKGRTTGNVGTYTIGSSIKTITSNLYIGGNGYKGTINSFTWYTYRFSDSEVNTFLGVQ